jgi:hypothetical protein
VTGRLRARPEPGSAAQVVSLVLASADMAAGRRGTAGVASPTDVMMRDRSGAYRLWLRPSKGVFFVDIPLAADGRLALAYSDGLVRPASTAEVRELIEQAGYDRNSQVLQFVMAPPQTQAEYEVFQAQVRRLAEELGRDAWIPGRGAQVEFLTVPPTFAVVTDSPAPVEWQPIRRRPAVMLGGELVRLINGIVVVGELTENGALAEYLRHGKPRADLIDIIGDKLRPWLGQRAGHPCGPHPAGLPRPHLAPVGAAGF